MRFTDFVRNFIIFGMAQKLPQCISYYSTHSVHTELNVYEGGVIQ
jgi:hypothetical protein